MGYSQWLKECAVSIGRRFGVGGSGADQSTANDAEESGTVPGVPNSSENDAGERADGYRSRAKQVIAAAARRREERKLWDRAETLDELGELTAQWAEGRILYTLGGYGDGQGPAEETLEIADALAKLNRSGFVTSQSQPGLREPSGWGYDIHQRAAVDGFADKATADRLAKKCDSAGLLFIRNGPAGWRTSYKNSVPVTATPPDGDRITEDSPYYVHTGSGVHLSRWATKRAGYNVPVLLAAEQVTIVDPEWCRKNYLWDTLTSTNTEATITEIPVPEVAMPEVRVLEVVVPSLVSVEVAIEVPEPDVAEPVDVVPGQVTVPDPVVTEVVVAAEPPVVTAPVVELAEPPMAEMVLQPELIEPEVTAVTAVMEPQIEIIEVAEAGVGVRPTSAYSVEQLEVPVGVTEPVVGPTLEPVVELVTPAELEVAEAAKPMFESPGPVIQQAEVTVVEPAVELVKVADSVFVAERPDPLVELSEPPVKPADSVAVAVPEVLSPQPEDAIDELANDEPTTTTTGVALKTTPPALNEPTLTEPDELTTPAEIAVDESVPTETGLCSYCHKPHFVGVGDIETTVEKTDPVVVGEPVVDDLGYKPPTKNDLNELSRTSPAKPSATRDDMTRQWTQALQSGEHTQIRGDFEKRDLFGCVKGECAVQVGINALGVSLETLEEAYGENYVYDVIHRNDGLKQSFPEIANHLKETQPPSRRRAREPMEMEL